MPNMVLRSQLLWPSSGIPGSWEGTWPAAEAAWLHSCEEERHRQQERVEQRRLKVKGGSLQAIGVGYVAEMSSSDNPMKEDKDCYRGQKVSE